MRVSHTSAAAVTCAIMNPDCSPPSTARKAGSPVDSAGLTIDSMRRSEMDPNSWIASAAWSITSATGSPWKLPPLSTSPSPGAPPSVANTSGLSVAALISR